MAENENKRGISEKEALEFAIELIGDADIEGAAEVVTKLEKMVDARSKKRDYTPDPEKIAKGNEFAAMWAEDTFKAVDVKIALGFEKAQPATGICTTMVNAGLWEVVPTTETVKVYRVVNA